LLSQYICLFSRVRVLTERTDLVCSLFARRARTQEYTGLAKRFFAFLKGVSAKARRKSADMKVCRTQNTGLKIALTSALSRCTRPLLG
jgi:hypothetical protein